MKTLSLYHPNTIQTVLSDLDRYIESFFGDSSVLTTRMTNQIPAVVPAVDIQENEHGYVLDMELPGFDEKNIDVHVDGANLTIASKQETRDEKKADEKQGAYLIKERKANVFSRSFKLPENADPQEVSAAFKNGVLSLQIKKRAEAQKRIIQINAA